MALTLTLFLFFIRPFFLPAADNPEDPNPDADASGSTNLQIDSLFNPNPY